MIILVKQRHYFHKGLSAQIYIFKAHFMVFQ